MTGTPSRRAVFGVALAAAALLGACGKAPAPIAGPTTEPSASATAGASAAPSKDSRPAAPLTGQPVDPAVAGRSAVAVAVAGSHPVGLDQADVVFEEISSPVRWLAVFQSRDADAVGPVVATRPADLMELGVLRPAYAFRGGTNGMVKQAEASELVTVNSESHGSAFSTQGADRFASTAKVRGAVSAPAARPMMVYGEGGPPTGLAGLKPAKQLVIVVRNGSTQTWKYDAAVKVWRRVGGGPAVATANLIVQVVPYKSVQLGNTSGIYVPSARVFGTGTAWVSAGPVSVPGRWSKPGLAQQTNYTDSSGVPVRLVPGRSWVVFAPTGSTVTAS